MTGTARCYEVRVLGHLDSHWAGWFPGMTLQHQEDGTTTLAGRLVDQAELHGVLARVRDLGVPLLSVSTPDRPGPRSGRRDPDPGVR